VIIACWALAVFAACNTQNTQPANNQPPSYHGVGVVKSINLKAPAIEIDHGDIEGLMPAMQMEFPVKDVALLNGIAVNDLIDFTIETTNGEMKVAAIKKK